MKRLLAGTGAACVFVIISSCSSFNGSFNTYHPTTIVRVPVPDNDTSNQNKNATATTAPSAFPPVSTNTVDTGIKVIESSIQPCPVDPFPAMAKTPDIPFKELKAAGNNKDEIEKVERHHIEELRAYISNLKRAQTKAKLDFVARCNTSAKNSN